MKKQSLPVRAGIGRQTHIRRSACRAFTLIELLVVLSIIAVLISILLPTMKEARRSAMVTLCLVNIQQQILGMTTYATSDGRGIYNPLPNVVADGPNVIARGLGSGAERTLAVFVEEEAGGNGEIFFCPFLAGGLGGPNGLGLFYSQYFWYHPAQDFYGIGYYRYAGFDIPWDLDWSNSGHSSPPPVMTMQDRTSVDVILTDQLTIIPRAGDSYMPYPHTLSSPWLASYRDYRENNVGYADGHAEVHGHSVPAGSAPVPPDPEWGGRWVKYTGYNEYFVW